MLNSTLFHYKSHPFLTCFIILFLTGILNFSKKQMVSTIDNIIVKMGFLFNSKQNKYIFI